ncbi:hypothetical protein OROHE_014088 [Orobanche hederae]
MEEEEDEKPPLVLCDDVYGIEYHVIEHVGYAKGGRVVCKAKYEIGMISTYVWIMYVKESDLEAYQNLDSQAPHYSSCLNTLRRDYYPNLWCPLLGPEMFPFICKGYYCMVALCAIHKTRKYVHRQISAAHIFIDEIALAGWFWVMLGYGDGVYDLTDDQASSSSSSSSVCRWAAAPEVYGSSDDATYGAKADIWLIGITALELAYGGLRLGSTRDDLDQLINSMHRMRKLPNKLNAEGRHCWKKEKVKSKLLLASCFGGHSKQRIAPTGFEYKPKEWVFSKKFVDLVLACLDLDPTKRPTASELLQFKIFDTVRNMSYFKL